MIDFARFSPWEVPDRLAGSFWIILDQLIDELDQLIGELDQLIQIIDQLTGSDRGEAGRDFCEFCEIFAFFEKK